MPRTVVLLEDARHLRAFTSSRDPSNPEFLLVACDNAVAASLSERGEPFIDETAMLDTHVAAENALNAPRVADQWADRCREAARAEGLGALPDFSGDISWPIEICLNAAHVYSRLLSDSDIEAVEFCDPPPRPMLRNGPAPAFAPAASLTKAVVSFIAENRGIALRKAPLPESSVRTERPWRPRVAMSERNARDSESCVRAGGDAAIALVWRDGLWESEIEKLRAILTGDLGSDVVELAPADLTVLSSIYDPRNGPTVLPVERLATLLQDTAPRDEAWPGLFASEQLAFQRAAIAAELHRSLQLQNVFAAIVDGLRPPVVVLGHDAFTVERALEDSCASSAVPTVSLAHSGLMPLAGYIGLVGEADVTCVWNAADRARLEKVGSPATRFAESGSLRFEGRMTEGDGLKRPVSGVCQKIVLLTSPTHVRLSFPTTHDVAYREAWEEIVRLSRAHSEWEFVIRPHPAFDQFEYYGQLVRDSGGRISISSSGSIEQVIAAAGAAVLVNYCSTAAIDVLLAGVPLVFLTSALRDSPLMEDPLRSAGATEVAAIADLEGALAELLHSPAAATRARQRGRSVLAKLLGASELTARVRFRRLLQSIVPDVQDREARREGAQMNLVAKLVSAGGRAVPPEVARRLIDGLVTDGRRAGLSSKALQRLALTAYIFAMRKRLEQKRWEEAAQLAAYALVNNPGAALRAEYWHVALKCLVMRRAVTHRIANSLDRWRSTLTRAAVGASDRRLLSRGRLSSPRRAAT